MFLLIAFPLACSHAPPETAPVLPPAPTPRPRTAPSSWNVPSWTGSSSYRFSRQVVVTSDSAGDRALVFDTAGGETFAHRAITRANTFTVAAVGANQAAEPLSATLVNGRLVLAKQSVTSTECDPSRNSLRSDLFDLAVQVPSTVSQQMGWGDSAIIEMCVGGLPGTARMIRHYTVLGDTALNDGPAVVLSRRDSTITAAEGILEQHPTVITGSAVSNVLLYVSESSGSVVRITKEQILQLSATAEGSTRKFVQKLSSVVDLVR